MKQISITIYFNGNSEKLDKQKEIEKLNNAINLDYDKYDINFTDIDNLPEMEKEYCKVCGSEIEL